MASSFVKHLQNPQSFERARSEVLTASDSSMGSSGGTTEVRMRVHSRNNLYLFRDGFLLPAVGHFTIDCNLIAQSSH